MRRPLIMCRLYEKSAPVGWGTAIYGGSPSKRATTFWALLCPASLRYARSRQAGLQKRDHERAGRKSASHASHWRVSTAGSGASALRPFAGGLSTSSATGDETHFCPVPLPEKDPLRRSARARARVDGGLLSLHSRLDHLDKAKLAFGGHRQLENLGTERSEGIGKRVGNGRRRADRSAFAHPAEAAHRGRARRIEMDGLYCRHLARGRDGAGLRRVVAPFDL